MTCDQQEQGSESGPTSRRGVAFNPVRLLVGPLLLRRGGLVRVRRRPVEVDRQGGPGALVGDLGVEHQVGDLDRAELLQRGGDTAQQGRDVALPWAVGVGLGEVLDGP
jgi:hypothetical protein